MQAKKALKEALQAIINDMGLPMPQKLVVEAPKQQGHGDLATNAAMLLARQAGRKPREMAELLAAKLQEQCPLILKAEAAGPGFCNVYFKPELWQAIVCEAEEKGAQFGKSDVGAGRKVLVEYVSANPTGPLHVGHGRGAALGDSVARLLRAAGYEAGTEYYLNDAGRQMHVLGYSIYLRAREIAGQKQEFPDDCYKGEYIRDLAARLLDEKPELLQLPEKEAREICRIYGMNEILRDIKKDMLEFRCDHQSFFSEAALTASGEVDHALHELAAKGKSYEKDGALWLGTAIHGDDHDRVLRKSDGSLTYFASDIAYHRNKFARGYDWLVDVWGADHHGYIPRMRAAIAEMGDDPDKFSVLLVQLVNLLRDGQKVSMSTRAGEFVTLAAVIEEVGVDAARFLFLSRSCDSPLDFDLELAKKRTLDNPVYYVQYAHARVCALMRRALDRGLALPERVDANILSALKSEEELALLRQLGEFEDVTVNAAKNLAPHHISRYLMELAGKLHSYYARQQIIDENDPSASYARLAMLRACGQTIKNGLFLLGVTAPDSM